MAFWVSYNLFALWPLSQACITRNKSDSSINMDLKYTIFLYFILNLELNITSHVLPSSGHQLSFMKINRSIRLEERIVFKKLSSILLSLMVSLTWVKKRQILMTHKEQWSPRFSLSCSLIYVYKSQCPFLLKAPNMPCYIFAHI